MSIDVSFHFLGYSSKQTMVLLILFNKYISFSKKQHMIRKQYKSLIVGLLVWCTPEGMITEAMVM